MGLIAQIRRRHLRPLKENFPTVLKFTVLAAALWLPGCNHSYQVKVDAVSKPEAEHAIAYEIRTTRPDLDPESLRYKEAARFVKTALSGKGLYEAPKPEMADMVIDLDYGISPPKATLERRTESIFQYVPGDTFVDVIPVGVDHNGQPIYQEVIRQGPPRQEYVGEREYLVTVITYEKHLRLAARANKPVAEGQPPADIWTVNVSTEGENHDLRRALPVLAAATIEYVGKDLRGEKTIKLKDTKDGAIAFVKKGM